LSYTPTESIRSRVPAPPNRCGRFPPSKRELDEGFFVLVSRAGFEPAFPD
jgi:hypothetical protein